jgi:hypothetical protein
LSLLDNLDKKAETDQLLDQEVNLKQYLKERLVSLLREEELKWYERAKVKTLLEGDANTRFFHLFANGKHRKQQIFKLEDDQGVVVEMIALNTILLITMKTFLGNQRLPGSPFSRIKSSISLRYLRRKMNLSLLPSLNLKWSTQSSKWSIINSRP